jgi:Holliday junction DNA helicase RuvB
VASEQKKKVERTLSGTATPEDISVERSLRPQTFAEFVGQTKVTDNLKIFVQAAIQRGEALDHILCCGPPGLGKTTLAHVVAHELGVKIVSTSGPAVERKGDLAGILTNLKERDVLFIDEIHRLPRAVEETLYPAMEDYHFDYIVGEGPAARNLKLRLPQFTLVGATTRTALLSSPMRDRFGVVCRLEFYPPEHLGIVLERSADILGVELDSEGAMIIASRARGTPRVANRLLRRVRDFAQVLGDGRINSKLAAEALDRLEVDDLGLDRMDHLILETIIEKFNGGPVGVEAIAASVSEERDTIEEVYEPYLLQEGLVQRTSRGRLATPKAFKHLGIEPPRSQSNLF